MASRRDVERAVWEAIRDSRELHDELHRVVDETEDMWRTVWDASGPHPDQTGTYRDSIKGRKLPIKLKRRGATPVGVVSSDDPQAEFIEYGTEDTPEFRPASRTADIINRDT